MNSSTMLFTRSAYKLWILLFSVLVLPQALFAQVTIEGNILKEDNAPVPFATISLLNHTEGVMSDAAGFFSLHLHSLKNADTLLISSVGYEPLKIPAQKALGKRNYVLHSFTKKMETVVIRSFGKEDMAGAKTDIIGYFRGWNTNNTGGEIGRGIYVPHKEYLVSKVRFKIFSTCDTCIIRLRIREFNTGFPGKDLLKDSVAQIFYKASVADKSYDFDISKYQLILNKENIFVSFEVLKGSSGAANCSLAFAGSDPGTYIYKPTGEGVWSMTNDYAIYLKVFFRYE